MEYLKKLNMICFSLMELKQLFKAGYLNKAFSEMRKKGYTLEDLKKDKDKMVEVANDVTSKSIKNKEDVEIFMALTSSIAFFGNDSKICFTLKNNYNVNKKYIKSLEDLKEVAKEDTLTDFAIWKNGLRQFQLKQYRNKLDTNNLFKFIKKMLGKYGNDLGDVNLLIQLQGPEGGKIQTGEKPKISNSDIDYYVINQKIAELKLNFKGEILIKVNEKNKFTVLNQVYPELKTMRKPIDQDYLAGKDLYN